MSKWRDFIDGTEYVVDLDTIIESIEKQVSYFKPKTLIEEQKIKSIKKEINEAKLEIKKLKLQNSILKNKVSILEEDLDL